MENRELRMYGLVMYNISPIQQGIQFGHAVVEYAQKWFDTPEYQEWATKHKTFMILNGGTSNHTKNRYSNEMGVYGTMEKNTIELDSMKIPNAAFFEPDLNDALSAVVFLVDDRVFDREKWPNYEGPYYDQTEIPVASSYWSWKMRFADTEEEADRILQMRNWLTKFRLA
jgi:hypothetical protein